ncbi:phosphopantetheine-binding protein [Fluviicola taffensis]|uniref:Acyl carrier protein n=1 Tax=Fluviicola taffensis (strain DSM 16823 / NCIMB 13979 / RW262) TaxID=755732 RepID=F2IDR0_FLUTR|nr:phosphopantetheine-binding protein [Fluviicola taffensis]AEA43433.1 acyl carrier protein [Fluviicola taffensis DSM 16823]
MSDLKETLKAQIIEQLNLEDLTPADIQDDASLFGDDGLGLDSIDALEFIVLLDSNYGIKIADPSQGKEIFYSINTLADYIAKNQ